MEHTMKKYQKLRSNIMGHTYTSLIPSVNSFYFLLLFSRNDQTYSYVMHELDTELARCKVYMLTSPLEGNERLIAKGIQCGTYSVNMCSSMKCA